MSVLISRNLKLFFRDRMAVFFSLLAIFISIALYVLFLSDTIMNGDLATMEQGRTMLNLWLLGGLMSMGAVTTTLAAYDTMIADRVTGKEKDFFVSSMPRSRLAGSYMISAIIIGFTMVCVTLLIGIAFFYVKDGITLSAYQIATSLAISICNVTASAVIFFPIVQALKTRSAFGNFSTLVGTLIGFLLGVYIPIGVLPSFAQTLIRIFPITHGCAMLRSLFTHEIIQDAIPVSSIVQELENELGITISFGDHVLTTSQHLMILGAVIVLFGAISMWCYRHHKQK